MKTNSSCYSKQNITATEAGYTMDAALIGWLAGGVGAAASGAAAVYGLTVKAQRPRLVRNERQPEAPFESVEWRSGEGTVKGWFLPQSRTSESAPTVIVAHGWGSNRSRVLRYVHPLHREGYSVLVYDARSHGDSDPVKAPSGLMFRDDLQSALRYLEGRADVDRQRIGVLGHSLGGFGAVLALDEGAPIAALVTDSMPVRFATMVESELRRRKLPSFPLAQLIPGIMVRRSRIPRALVKRANPAEILADNARGKRVPVMLVHSRGDTIIPPAELYLVLSRVPDANHLFVDVNGHSASERDPAFWPAVTGFFKEHLSSPQKTSDGTGGRAARLELDPE